jgi:hypothetical protein
MEGHPGWMHRKQSNNNHQTRFIREGPMPHTPNTGSKTGAHTFSIAQGNACTFYSDAARHGWSKNPESKPDIFSRHSIDRVATGQFYKSCSSL